MTPDEMGREVRRILRRKHDWRSVMIAVVVARQNATAMKWERTAIRLSKTVLLARKMGSITDEDVKFWTAVGNAVDTLTDPAHDPRKVVLREDGTCA